MVGARQSRIRSDVAGAASRQWRRAAEVQVGGGIDGAEASYSRLDTPGMEAAELESAEVKPMRVVTQKQLDVAMNHIAGLLEEDGVVERLTVQEWLDIAEVKPSGFTSSLPALKVVGLLGFGDEVVKAEVSN